MIESVPPPIEKCTLDDTSPGLLGFEQYTYEEVAQLKRVTKQTVMEWVKRGMIPSPVYTGVTARFTTESVAEIMNGTSAPGTYPVTLSPRAQIAKQAREARELAIAAAAQKEAEQKMKRALKRKKTPTLNNKSKQSKPGKKPQRKGAKS